MTACTRRRLTGAVALVVVVTVVLVLIDPASSWSVTSVPAVARRARVAGAGEA